MNYKDSITFNAGLENERSCYYYRLNDDPHQPRIQYTPESRKAIIHIPSVPHFINGSSLIPLLDGDVPILFDKLKDYVESGINAQNVSHSSQWEIIKGDLYHDFDVGDKVQSYIAALKQITIPGFICGCYGVETVFWRTLTTKKELRFYDKHQKCINSRSNPLSINMSQGILRFEVSITGQELRYRIGSHYLGDVFKENICNSILVDYLKKCNVNNLSITTTSEMYKALEDNYGSSKALTLIGYLNAKANNIIIHHLHRTTVNKYHREIKALSLAPIIHYEKLPPLIIQPLLTSQN